MTHCSSYNSDYFALGATLLQMWAFSEGDESNGPLYARKQERYEDDDEFLEDTIKLWTAFLNGPDDTVPPNLIEKCRGLRKGITMPEETRELIAQYYHSTPTFGDDEDDGGSDSG